VFGLELVAGYLVAYVVTKVRRIGGRLDDEVDALVDAGLDRLHRVVAAKLGRDPAVAKLEAEAAEGGAADERTQRRVTDAVEAAAEEDPDFAAALGEAVRAVQSALAARPAGASEHLAVTMTANVSGHGRAYQAGRDLNISGQ
jgi:hypothetical protein